MSEPTDGPARGFADDAHRYQLESRIATGGMGEVWRATDTVLGRQVAVKLLKAEYADDSRFRSRFETEARHAASLHHPNVAAVYDFGEAAAADGSGQHRPYLVMELIEGQPLSALLRAGEPMDPDATRDLLSQAGDAIGAAHAAGIVHRDIKPANLMVTPERQVKITDFGIARATEGLALTETGQVMGTPQYLSPEQARGEAVTPASDVYSLGVVAFECLAGRRPFVAETPVATALAHLREPVPELPDDVPADLAAVVRRALSKDPADRYPNADAFAVALRDPATAATAIAAAPVAAAAAHEGDTQVLAPVPAPTPAPTPAQTPVGAPLPGQRRRVNPSLVVAGLALVALVVAIILMLTSQDDASAPTEPDRRTPPSRTAETSTPTTAPTSASTSAPPSTTPTSPSASSSGPVPSVTLTPSDTSSPSDSSSPSSSPSGSGSGGAAASQPSSSPSSPATSSATSPANRPPSTNHEEGSSR